MKHTPILGWNSAKLASCLLCAIVVAVVAVDCSAADAAKTESKAIPQELGILGMQVPCTGKPYKPPDANNNQTITITVERNSYLNEPIFQVKVEPKCAGLSHHGMLKFSVKLPSKDDGWKESNTIDVEFGLPGPDEMLPLLKGPFNKGAQTRRGIYNDVEHKKSIPENDFVQELRKGWTDSYTVRVWSATGDFLGEVDPGVKVIDDPGGLSGKP